jgi:hypothetical protein
VARSQSRPCVRSLLLDRSSEERPPRTSSRRQQRIATVPMNLLALRINFFTVIVALVGIGEPTNCPSKPVRT